MMFLVDMAMFGFHVIFWKCNCLHRYTVCIDIYICIYIDIMIYIYYHIIYIYIYINMLVRVNLAEWSLVPSKKCDAQCLISGGDQRGMK